jgi:hypothetical protein
MDKIVNILAGITTVALVSVLVSSKETANIIRSLSSGYAGALREAKR